MALLAIKSLRFQVVKKVVDDGDRISDEVVKELPDREIFYLLWTERRPRSLKIS